MEEIRSVRRNQIRAALKYQQPAKAEKQDGAAPGTVSSKQGAPSAAASLDLKQLMGRINQTEARAKKARQVLQTNEATLAEVKDSLERMEELAKEAESQPENKALQEELSKLRQELMRILGGGTMGANLFTAERGRDVLSQLPAWLLWGLADAPDPGELLEALGLDPTASGSEIMAALSKLTLDDPAAGYLAAVYLGSVIANGGTDKLDAAQAAEGLLRLLKAIEGGQTPDEAVSDLTDGLFDSLEDFQRQFIDGLAPGMRSLFSGMFLGAMPDLMDLLSNGSGGELELLLKLLVALEGLDDMLLPGLGEGIGQNPEADGKTAPQPSPEPRDMGTVTAESRDPSSVTHDGTSNTITIRGEETVVLRGQERQAPELELTGRGETQLHNVNTPKVTVDSAQAQLRTQGGTEVHQLSFKEKAVLTLLGSGLTRIGDIKGGPDNVLHLKEGAFMLERQAAELPVRLVIDGAVILNAPKESRVFGAGGEELEPYDLQWKEMFPQWNAVESIVIDGRHAQVALMRSAQPDIARLWLMKGDPSQGYPAHLIALEGRDRAGELRTRYVYLQWSRMQRKFVPVSMFPNPFTVTGGEEDIDWRYEEDSRTLRVLTGKVDGLSGGMGTDAGDRPFSGRLAFADGIGAVELTLDGVMCMVPSGRACSLGRGNRVTLMLKRGTENLFESGSGCAGISLGDGTALYIDQPNFPGEPDGILTAKGGAASPGIGRDSGLGRGQTAPIIIRGGRVKAIEGRQSAAGKEGSGSGLAGLRVSARALRLDAMDISTKEAARDAVKQLSAGKRWVNRLQDAYRAVYGKLEQSLTGLGSVRQYTKVVRDGSEADTLMWDMRQELLQSTAGPHGQWDMDDLGQLLDAMEDMINR